VNRSYPFVPKSNRTLTAGQFWSLPLSTGRYAAGRVIVARSLGPEEHRIFIVNGLLDWSGDEPPTEIDIAGRAALFQAISNFDVIAKNGGAILGERPLDLDGLTPMPMGRVGDVTTVSGWRAF